MMMHNDKDEGNDEEGDIQKFGRVRILTGCAVVSWYQALFK